jgi:hypothetical protein
MFGHIVVRVELEASPMSSLVALSARIALSLEARVFVGLQLVLFPYRPGVDALDDVARPVFPKRRRARCRTRTPAGLP